MRRLLRKCYRVFRRIWRLITNEDAKAEAYIDTFIAAMNGKARQLGVDHPLFTDPSGYYCRDARVSAHDMLIIFGHSLDNAHILEFLKTKDYSIDIAGIKRRTKKIETTVKSADFDEGAYPIIAGKTGTYPDHAFNILMLTRINSGRLLACSILGSPSDEDRWKDAFSIVRYAERVLEGEDAALQVSAASFEVCEYPSMRPVAAGSPEVGVSPASLTKVLTALTAIDYVDDWNQRLTIHQSDVLRGSGNNLRDGDVVTVRDLFYDMLLPSSNSAARALARFVGRKMNKAKTN